MVVALYDISVPIANQLPVWPGDPRLRIERTSRMEAGDPFNVSQITMGTHTGTHVDPPFHFMANGATLDEVPLERWIGPAWVADCRGSAQVTGEQLEGAGIPDGCTRLLLLTDNSALWENPSHAFKRAFVSVSASAADWIRARGIQLVGIDYMSVDRFDDEQATTHHLLLPHGILVIENLDLRHVPPNRAYELLCLPLKIVGGDGAPARVVLRG